MGPTHTTNAKDWMYWNMLVTHAISFDQCLVPVTFDSLELYF